MCLLITVIISKYIWVSNQMITLYTLNLTSCYMSTIWHTTVSECYMLSCFSHIWLCATLWTVAHQVPWSMKLSRQEYWSRLSVSSSRGSSQHNPGIKSESFMFPALVRGFFTTSATWEVVSTARKSFKNIKEIQ